MTPRTWRRRWFIQIVFIAGIVCASEARAMTIIGTLYKTYADRPNTPAAGFSVMICDQYGSCPAQGQTDSGGSFSFQGPLQPRYYSLYAWNDADLWGSQYVSEYQPTFVLTSPVDNGGTVNLGRVITSPRPLVPLAVKPLNNGVAFPSPCTTTFNWTDGLDSMRRSTKWPVNYQITVVQPTGAAFTYSVNSPSLSLNLPIAGGSYLWYVVARLGVAQSPPGSWIYLETRSPNFSLWVPNSAGDCSTPINDAVFVGQEAPPSSLNPGEVRNVSVTMQNTGTTIWSESTQYRLGPQNPQDNGNWQVGRVFLAPGESVPPGQRKKFTFNITAPSASGVYNFQWRMLREGVEWFGASTPNVAVTVNAIPVDDAVFVNQTPILTQITAGSTTTVSITMRNSGTTVWNSDYRLGSQNPQDNQTWGLGRVFLASGETVAPGQQTTFTFTITAPGSPGTYNFQWRMVHEMVQWFGAFTPNLTVAVGTAPPASPTGLTPDGTTLSSTSSVTLSWAPTPGATKYAVRLQDNTDGTLRGPNNCPGNPALYICINDIGSTSYAATVVPGHSYTWWVHAGNDAGYSGPTYASFSVSTGVTPPAPPTGLTPNGVSLPAMNSVTLSWYSTPGATKYAVRLQDNTDGTLRGPNNCPGNPALDICINDIVSTSYAATVVPGHSYTWWVHAGNDAGYSGPTYASFSVATEPLHAPTGLAKEASPSRNLVWNPPDNLTGADQVTYDLWLYGGSNCAGGCLYHPGAPSWYTMGSEIDSGNYTWTLKANSVSRPSSGAVSGPAFNMP